MSDALKRSVRRGISLVELLVVIAIIGILLTLLIPVITGVRKQADATNCSSNLRQIGVAIQTRASERGGFAPLAGMIFVPASAQGSSTLGSFVGDSARQRYDYVPTGTPLLGEVVASFQLALAKQLGVKDPVTRGYVPPPELLSKWEVFTCPRSRPRHPTSTTFLISIEGAGDLNVLQTVPMDFALNDAVFGYGPDRLAGKLAKIADASRTFLLADAAPPGASPTIGDGTPMFWSPTPDNTRPLTLRDAFEENGQVTSQLRLFDPIRHANRINVLFADGHVQFVALDSKELSEVVVSARQ